MVLTALRRRVALRSGRHAPPRTQPTLPAAANRDGFGLIESLAALGVAAAGLLAVAGLMAVGATLQRRSRDGGQAGNVAVQQMEQLRVLPLTDPRVQVGGSLAGNAAVNPNNYTALINVPPSGLVRLRWQVGVGPANSRVIEVRATPTVPGARVSEVRSIVWRPDAVPLP